MFIHNKFILFSLIFKTDFLHKHKFIRCLKGLSLEWTVLKSRPLFLGLGKYQKLNNNYHKQFANCLLVGIHSTFFICLFEIISLTELISIRNLLSVTNFVDLNASIKLLFITVSFYC